MSQSGQRKNSSNEPRGEYSTKQYRRCGRAGPFADCISSEPLQNRKRREKDKQQRNQNLTAHELVVREQARKKDFQP
jgi:hypothetical protein